MHTFHVSLITGVNLRFGSLLRILFIFLLQITFLRQKSGLLAGLSLATGSQECENEYVKLERGGRMLRDRD